MFTIQNLIEIIHRLIAFCMIHFFGQQYEAALGQICSRDSDECGSENYIEDMDEIRLLLLGKAGSGKSTTGNAILGKEVFKTSSFFSSETKRCTLERNSRNGTMIEIVDTPGLFDTDMTNEKTISIILQTVVGMHPGPDAFLYIIKIDRFTEEEARTYTLFKQFFDDALSRYTILVFTTGDKLHGQKVSLEDIIKKAPKDLRELAKQCDNRMVALSNVSPDKEKGVTEIMDVVRKLRHKNERIPYSSNKYKGISQITEEKITRATEESIQEWPLANIRDRRWYYKQKLFEDEGFFEEIREKFAQLWEWMLGIFKSFV